MVVSVKYCQSLIHKAHMCWVGTPLAIAQILYTRSKNLLFTAFGCLRFDMNRTAKHRETKMETWARTWRMTVAFHLTDVKCHCYFLSLQKNYSTYWKFFANVVLHILTSSIVPFVVPLFPELTTILVGSANSRFSFRPVGKFLSTSYLHCTPLA